MPDPKTTLQQVAVRCFSGLGSERIAAELGLGIEQTRASVERVEAVRLLISRSFPEELIHRAARLEGWEVETILDAARQRGDAEKAGDALGKRSSRADLPANESTDEALEVLDFWTSKWD